MPDPATPTPTPAAEALPAQAPDTPRPDTSHTEAAPAPAQAPSAETVPPLPAELRPAPPAADQPVPPDDPALSSKTAEPDPDWHPTENPKSTLVPGQMRSDREEVPAPFTKEDADKAEIAEAGLRSSRSLTASSCQVYWPSWFQVCGAIRDKYNALGGPASFLSYPTSGNILNPGGTGERVTFANGPIYWSAATGAHPVVNSFLNRWGIHGYEAGWLGYPTTDEIVHADAVGRRQEFQNGAIYVAFVNAIGSAIPNGPIRDKWNSVGAETPGSLLGYPIQDQIPLPDGQGQMDRFERGVIYWHPTTGAHPLTGVFEWEYSISGYENGQYGYPITDEVATPTGGRTQSFQLKKMSLFEPTEVDSGIYGFNFHPASDVYTDQDEVGKFDARVDYSFAPDKYPMGWGMIFSEGVKAVGQNGGATVSRCQARVQENGKRTSYNWDHYSPGKEITLDYIMHSTVPNHKIGAVELLYGWCTFPDKSGQTIAATWTFDYTVLDFN
ncbi:LGFP repeat-containing protein [Rhodococcus aetherivorans]|uniref:LGFP repeat-containing protein n=1 Tax=Rhodococcus aetherivorans TaxID=191292 RepID=UPI0021A612DC|nr:hypothetical protein [Rhodococcus aetherivorans]